MWYMYVASCIHAIYKQPGTPDCHGQLVEQYNNESYFVRWSEWIFSQPNLPLTELFQVNGVQNTVSMPVCFIRKPSSIRGDV